MRKPGYYWVKRPGDKNWLPAYWTGEVWHVPDYDVVRRDEDLTAIHESRLTPPEGEAR